MQFIRLGVSFSDLSIIWYLSYEYWIILVVCIRYTVRFFGDRCCGFKIILLLLSFISKFSVIDLDWVPLTPHFFVFFSPITLAAKHMCNYLVERRYNIQDMHDHIYNFYSIDVVIWSLIVAWRLECDFFLLIWCWFYICRDLFWIMLEGGLSWLFLPKYNGSYVWVIGGSLAAFLITKLYNLIIFRQINWNSDYMTLI